MKGYKKQLPSRRPPLASSLLAATSIILLSSSATAATSAASASQLSSSLLNTICQCQDSSLNLHGRICSNSPIIPRQLSRSARRCLFRHSTFLVVSRGGHASDLNTDSSYTSTYDGSESSSGTSSDGSSGKMFGGKIVKSSSTNMLPPLIDIPSMNLALRLTCETNRRIFLGTFPSDEKDSTNGIKKDYPNQEGRTNSEKFNIGHYPQQQQHLSSTVSTMGIPPVILSISNEERTKERRDGDSLTVFHSPIPWKCSFDDRATRDDVDGESSNLNSMSTSLTSATSASDSELNDDIRYAKKSEGREFVDENHTQRRGIARWGPDLDLYLNSLLSSIGLGPNQEQLNPSQRQSQSHQHQKQTLTQKILLLTILYIEKSTSLDTPRIIDPRTGQPYYPPVPYLMPRTVHRLILTAFSLSVKRNVVMGSAIDVSVEEVTHILRTAVNSLFQSDHSLINGQDDAKKPTRSHHEISEFEMQQMEHWMIHALGGDPNLHYHHYNQNYYQNYHPQQQYQQHWPITPEEMTTFLYKWGETFYPQRLRMYEEKERHRASSLMERWDMFWRWSHQYHHNNNNNHQQHHNNNYQQQNQYHQRYLQNQHENRNVSNQQHHQSPAPQYHQAVNGHSGTNTHAGWNPPREDHSYGNENMHDCFPHQHQSLHNSNYSE